MSRRFSALSTAAVAQLERACTRVSLNPSILSRHGDDESHHVAMPPQAVAFARSVDEIQAVVRTCGEHGVPLIPFGTGTSLEGHIQAINPAAVSLDLSEMDEVLEVNDEDLDCRVQAGVTRKRLNEHLRYSGLFFPIDPGADASLGGMVACGASGTAAVKYGSMRTTTLGLTAVLASGEVVRTGGRARKSSAGYNLTNLLVGSEGTLAVIAEAQLRLSPLPASVSAATCVLPSLAAAASAVAATLQSGIPVARCELLDAATIGAYNAYSRQDLEVGPTLFFEFEGLSDASVAEQAELASSCCAEHGGTDFRWAASEEERKKLWAARHAAYYAVLALRPGARGVITDACVPISRLAEVMSSTADDVQRSGVVGPIFGHAGDGNFHCILLARDDDPPEYVQRLHGIHARLVERSLAAGGTCTGEHGVGVGKKKYLDLEFGEEGVAVMRSIKRALDPNNLLNPGKVIDL